MPIHQQKITMQIKHLIGTIRAKFLLLPIVCILLAIAPTIREQL